MDAGSLERDRHARGQLPMKGRRRARRLALQALYELDQSVHAYDEVVIGRCQAILSEWFDRSGAEVGGGGRARLIERLTASIADSDPGLIRRLDEPRVRQRFVENVVTEVFGAEGMTPEGSILRERIEGLADVIGQLAFAVRIVDGVTRSRGEIDTVIARIAPEWPVDQMAPVDRNLLRIAIWEIGAGASPQRVAINEAVELAREFSGESSRRMVNGALGAYTSASSDMIVFEVRDLGADERTTSG